MGKSEIFELLIYGLRIASIITMVLGIAGMVFLDFVSSLSLLVIGIGLLIFSYYILV